MANLQINQLTTVATTAVTSSANFEIQDAGQPNPQSRQLNLLAIFQLFGIFRATHSGVTALSSGMRIAAGTASVTGTLAINTGLTTVAYTLVSLGQAPTSQVAEVASSVVASSGWTSVAVYAQATATNVNPVVSGTAGVISWISVGT